MMEQLSVFVSQFLIEFFIIGFFSLLILAFVLRFVTRTTRRRSDIGPWIGYTMNFSHGPEAGKSYLVKSVQDGFVVLEELNDRS